MTDLDTGRRIARRRMAQISFGVLLAMFLAVVPTLLWSDDRVEIAKVLTSASPILIGLLTAFTTILMAYLGVSVAEKISKGPKV